jgi:phosphopantothenoylcysteine decarboxylase/phosphopantothenate--cysteine ligase
MNKFTPAYLKIKHLTLKGKKIIIGVTGSIAAYKAAILIRLLVKEGAEVKVIMTPFAKEFITPLTLATLAKSPVLIDFFSPENGDWNNHVDMGIWADAYVIAPATANTIAKMAIGIADNLLLTTYLSARCPVFIAPAMDVDMLNHTATMQNIEKLAAAGNIIIQPATGELASGLEGKGRMEEPEAIVKTLTGYFKKYPDEKKNSVNRLSDYKVLVTAGPTFEPIDPVRYIGNYSSGKMGFALAEALINNGAEVYLVSGPVHISPPDVKKYITVQTSDEMFAECKKLFKLCDIGILSAAVADYKPETKALHKIKSTAEKLDITLTKNVDIAAELGKDKKDGQLLIGFALETEHAIENAVKKMTAKNFDCIILNSLEDENAGFGYDTNKITLIGKDNKIIRFGLKKKSEVAIDIVNYISEKLL